MNKVKKLTFSLIFIGIVSILFGVTYSFFNYTRTGGANNFSVGRINFISRQTETFNLTNMFPIDPEENGIMDDDTKVGTMVLEIEGDTDYINGLEYLVSVVDANITSSNGKLVPVSLDISVTGLGSPSNNYFTARESKDTSIYKKLIVDTIQGNGMLLVGYIKPNTTQGNIEGVDGSITIKAYFDENKIGISDTYDMDESNNPSSVNEWAEGKTIFTTSEWNNLNVSFKIKVEANEGIWVNGSLEEVMKKTAVMDNIASTYVSASTGINFGAVSSDTNGKGVYIRSGTENDDYPIMYYRGDINDNNVLFGHQCWKTVRTTETGGVKLIYNGMSDRIVYYKNNTVLSDTDITYTNDATYPYTYDSTTKKWTSGNAGISRKTGRFRFSVKETGTYSINYDVSCESKYDYAYVHINDSLVKITSGEHVKTINLGQITPSDEIVVSYYKNASINEGRDNVIFEIVRNDTFDYETEDCDERHKYFSGLLKYGNFSSDEEKAHSMAYIGYMYGNVYEEGDYHNWNANARFGSGFTWDGTNYTLIDDTVTVPDNTHHYSCNLTTEHGTCSQIRFVHSYYGDNGHEYITLTGGVGIEEAMEKMFENTNDSDIKQTVDEWYEGKMTDYTNKLEDTIWCNDRSFSNIGGYSPTGIIDGMNWGENYMLFGAYRRSNTTMENNPQKNKPSLECINKNDRFTVNNTIGNGKLTYPVALLTSDELVLSGGVFNVNSLSYVLDGSDFWTMSPGDYAYNAFNIAYFLVYDGSMNTIGPLSANNKLNVRPSISLKPGQLITKGTGTELDPYVIE